MEMVARVRAVLRRSSSSSESAVLKLGGLAVNLDERIVTADGSRIRLTYKEFALRIHQSSGNGIYQGAAFLTGMEG